MSGWVFCCWILRYLQKDRVILGFLVYTFMYKDNDRGDSGGDVVLSGSQDRPPKWCFNIVNIPGVLI